MLGDDLLAEPLERQARRGGDEPLVALLERAQQLLVALGSVAGSERSMPTKSGRFGAARRISTSASFETPTNGDASTLTSASSS